MAITSPNLRLSKKQDIVQAATLLFAEQGFDGTTTLQISKDAGITEPVIYYHFKGKDELFTGIIASTFETFFAHLDDLPEKTNTEFEKIENLIALHFDIVKEMPDEIYLAVSSCPARLKDPDDICRKNVLEVRRRMFGGRHGHRRVSHGSCGRHGQPDQRHDHRIDAAAGPEV